MERLEKIQREFEENLKRTNRHRMPKQALKKYSGNSRCTKDASSTAIKNTMEEFEKQIQSIRDENKFILERFKNNLREKKLSKSTVDKHVDNIDFFINEFLLKYEPIPANEGASEIGFFLGNWFIRKALWASVTSIKENITSMKKFYQFMYETGEIEKDDLVELKDEITNCKDEWLENIRMYDNPNIDLDDIW